MEAQMQLFWLCFELVSHPTNRPPCFGNGGLLIYSHLGGLIWVIYKEELWSSGCLLDHSLLLFWLLFHRSERLGRLQLTTVSPLWLSFISSQLTNAYWLFSVHIHCCTWLNKIFTTTLWLGLYCFPTLHVRELSFIMCRRSGQATDKDHFWTRSLWIYRLWQAAGLPAALEVSVHYLLSLRNELNKMSPKFGYLLLSWKINTRALYNSSFIRQASLLSDLEKFWNQLLH